MRPLAILLLAAASALAAAGDEKEDLAVEKAAEVVRVIDDADDVSDEDLAAKQNDIKEIGKAMRLLDRVFKREQNEKSSACGVVSRLEDYKRPMTWANTSHLMPQPEQCHQRLSTNCTISFRQMTCPDECPYMAPDLHYPCMFSCRAKHRCSGSNVDTPFPDPHYLLCSKCSVVGCKYCSGPDTCAKCHGGFIEKNGTCVFGLTSIGWASMVMFVLIAMIVLLVLMAVCSCLAGSRSPHAQHNMRSIEAGRVHRHLSKVNDWDLEGKAPRKRYSLTVPTDTENILGMGLGLYYNSIRFVFLVVLLTVGAAWIISDSIGLRFVLQSSESSGQMKLFQALEQTQIRKSTIPAVIVSPLMSCAAETPEAIEEKLASYAQVRAKVLGALYIVLFSISAFFVHTQKRFASRFDKRSTSMCDFCVLLQGLPPTCTDEVKLKQWAEEQLKKSMVEPAGVIGVSICYDYGKGEEAKDRQKEVDSMLDRFCSATEIKLRMEGKLLGDDGPALDVVKETLQHLKDSLTEDRAKVVEWFEGEKKMVGTGQVFLILETSAGKDKLMENYLVNPKLFTYEGQQLKVDVVQSEPPDVFWENLATDEKTIRFNEWKALFQVLVTFCWINILVYLFNWFVVMPYLAAGSSAGGPITTLNGIIMAIINGQLGGQVFNAAHSVGYHRKDRADIWLFNVNFFITLCNTLFNLALTIYGVQATDPDASAGLAAFLAKLTSVGAGLESEIGYKLYLMLIPGQLFVNPAMGYLTGHIVQYVQFNLVAKIIYVWKCLPESLLNLLKLLLPYAPDSLDKYDRKDAEMGFRAGQIGLPWDYSNLILNPLLVYFTFFFVSTSSWMECLGLLGWTVFFFCFSRFMHLRVNSVGFYSTNKLDWNVWMVWGAPLSMLSTCAVAWELRTGLVLATTPLWQKWILLFLCYGASCMLWVFVVLVLHPMTKEKGGDDRCGDFHACKDQWIFSWFNCNPIFTLKCLHYLPKLVSDAKTDKAETGTAGPEMLGQATVWGHPIACGDDPNEVRYYSPGKAYLHFKPEKQKIIQEGDFHDWLEFETYLEALFRWADVCSKRRGRVEPRELYETLKEFKTLQIDFSVPKI